MRNHTIYPGMDYSPDPAAQARREVEMIVTLDNIYKSLLELIRLQTPKSRHDG